eukprot:gnl/Hemi2/11289_TR3902_c0_g1_i1.p1 gnl/Hemi2/11289_TR3902_c0_g1~~gnl/Hemi2/11289_TR3902_c0_g1_i1.p1  ORF type:complete len:389 (-),score=77.57 gnl/Hemi2/11289_TR3902_c0_g1_i1:188-1354(-)
MLSSMTLLPQATATTVLSAAGSTTPAAGSPANYVVVHNETVLNDLADGVIPPPLRAKPLASTMTVEKRSQLEAIKRRRETMRETANSRNERLMEATRKKLERSIAKREQEFHDNVQSLLQEQADVYQQVICAAGTSTLVELKQASDRRKKEALYNEWNKNVYQKIQSDIKEKVASLPERHRLARHKEISNSYMTATFSTRGGNATHKSLTIGRYPPDEQVQLADPIKYSTKDIHDPLKRDLDKTTREKSLLTGMKPPTPLPRNCLQSDDISLLTLSRKKRTEESTANNPPSKVVFDAYDLPKLSSELLEKELGRMGKRTFPNNGGTQASPTPAWKPRGIKIFDEDQKPKAKDFVPRGTKIVANWQPANAKGHRFTPEGHVLPLHAERV